MQENEQAKTDEELENEAFLAEMGGSEVDVQAPADTETQGEESADIQQDDPVDSEAQPDLPKVERKELIAGLTEEEIKEKLELVAKLQKSIDVTNGTYGSQLHSLKQRIEELTSNRQQKVEGVVTKISPDRFSRLKQEYPELSELLAEDLSELLGASSQPDLTQFESMVQQRLDEERQERAKELQAKELRLLKREHPDFNEVAGYGANQQGIIQWNNPAFGNWVASQPQDIQDKVINGDDAFELADIISDYKRTLKQETKQKPNLERAIQPKGIPASRGLSDLDEEERAFREEMARGY